MPTNKDFKRIVRARMTKTGESYTTARAQILKKRRTTDDGGRRRAPAARALPERYAKLAGMSDAAVKAKTGCAWPRWVKVLDHHGAAAMSHREIAKLVRETYDPGAWWAQAVTVGYERIRGLREVGQRRGGAFEASKSKTLPVPVGALYRAARDKRRRWRWLETEVAVRTATPNKSVRFTWLDGTPVELSFVAKGKSKSQVTVQHGKLPDKDAVVRMKMHWGERLGVLASLLRADARTERGSRRRP